MKCSLLAALATLPTLTLAAEPRLAQPANSSVKRSPLADGPPSPGLGYETSMGYDPKSGLVIRWGGHNQGGGGEQNAETWTFDLLTGKWTLKEPNTSPVGVCCAEQNVFAPSVGRFIRFPAFSGSHGWHWFRENYLNNTAVWSYDLATNTWRDMRPANAPRLSPLRCASWDSDHQVIVVFGGENNQEGTLAYDPYTNRWTRMNPKQQPAFRSGGNMAYDAEHKLHILFGSQFTDDPHTWAYDLKKNEWRDLKPAVQPPTDRNDAVLAYDANGKVVIAVVRVADRKNGDEIVTAHLETWAFDAGQNTWTKMNPKDEPAGKNNRNRLLVAVPDQNVILMEQVVHKFEEVDGSPRDQQVWTYRYAGVKPDPRPQPPMGLKAMASNDAVTITWQPSPSQNVKEYVIYRGWANYVTGFQTPRVVGGAAGQPFPSNAHSHPRPWEAEFKEIGRVGPDQAAFRDKEKGRGIDFYRVRAVTADGRESADGARVRTQPPLVEDVVLSVISDSEVRLSWKAPAPDVTRYVIERANVEVFSDDQILRLRKDTEPLPEPSVGAIKAIGAFEPCWDPVEGTSFVDRQANLHRPLAAGGELSFVHRFPDDRLHAAGKPYRLGVAAYRVRAVGRSWASGGDSPYVLTIPSAPQHLFAREEGDQCHLKWAANPEQGIKGYRVYRMDGPKLNGPGQVVRRLTPEPITETRFTDTKAGKETARYWVVAVDALGQEGFPSAPAWHYRQWRKFYEPFVGEWHQ